MKDQHVRRVPHEPQPHSCGAAASLESLHGPYLAGRRIPQLRDAVNSAASLKVDGGLRGILKQVGVHVTDLTVSDKDAVASAWDKIPFYLVGNEFRKLLRSARHKGSETAAGEIARNGRRRGLAGW